MSIAIAIVIFSLLIFVHELGHFAAAKLLGVRVLEFSLFMGPRLFSVVRGETRYSIKLVPIGGSCMMEGEEQSSDDGRALCKKPKWARAVIMAAGPFVNILVAVLALAAANFFSGYQDNVVSYVVPDSPAAVASTPLMAGDRVLRYAGRAVNVPVELDMYAQDTRGAEAQVAFRRGGALHVATILPETIPESYYIIGFTGATAYGPDWNLAVAVEEGAPAYAAGMREGDRLLTVGGRSPGSREELRGILADFADGQAMIEWERPGAGLMSGAVEPRHVESYGGYETGMLFASVDKPSLPAALGHAYFDAVSYAKMVGFSLKWLVTGQAGLNQVSGPVGIVAEIGSVVSQDVNEGVPPEQAKSAREAFFIKLFYLLRFSSLIGVNLGLVNLIPFPALDGSKLLLIGVEAVRRKAMPPEREALISFVGLVALMVVMAFTFFNDIGRLVAK